MKSNYIECSCNHSDHLIRFSYFEDEKDHAYVEFQRDHNKSFIEKLKICFNYLFSVNNLQAWHETVMSKQQVLELKTNLEEFLKD